MSAGKEIDIVHNAGHLRNFQSVYSVPFRSLSFGRT